MCWHLWFASLKLSATLGRGGPLCFWGMFSTRSSSINTIKGHVRKSVFDKMTFQSYRSKLSRNYPAGPVQDWNYAGPYSSRGGHRNRLKIWNSHIWRLVLYFRNSLNAITTGNLQEVALGWDFSEIRDFMSQNPDLFVKSRYWAFSDR